MGNKNKIQSLFEWWWKIALLASLAVFACTWVACSTFVPRQGWDANRGPVVPHDTFPTDCSRCHISENWHTLKKDFVFDHAKETGVALKGRHLTASCLMCHNDRGPVKRFAARGCAGCHTDVHQGREGNNCTSCHNEELWRVKEARERHDRTRFPLVGAHVAASCSSCHKGAIYGKFEPLGVQCLMCHEADYKKTTKPNHVVSGFSTDCTTCHTQVGWTAENIVHPSAFPLTSGHGGLSCAACHKTATASNKATVVGNKAAAADSGTIVFTKLSTECLTCHIDKYNATTNPNHKASGFSTECKTCHAASKWTAAKFKHAATFPLTGGHSNRACADCHKNGVYTGLNTACATCHTTKFNATTNPPHATAGFDTTCVTCHNTTAWAPAMYKHTTTFPLTAGHAGQTCNACHQSGTYKGLPATCVSCHQAKYNATTKPNHMTIGFGTDCQSCHTTTKWTSAKFSHPATFPLTKGHAGQSCTACHKGGVYTGLSTNCANCHTDKYNATTAPDHHTAGFGTDCKTCHTTLTWQGASFQHPKTFPLTNAHANQSCSACHKNGVYTGLSPTCVSCHQQNFNTATNPNHTNAKFNTTCVTCHTTSAWKPAIYTHVASFPLTNGHAGPSCTACHTGGVYKGLPATCVSCHLTKYNATTAPKHSTAGYGTDCKSCHTGTTTWLGAAFNHPATFPLTNAHANKACTACHTGGVYTGLNTACASCHTTKYNATTNPKHSAAAFNTTCNTCHTTTAWTPTNYTHIASFPLTNGHAVASCATCHTGNVYKGLPATCVSCHQAKYNATTAPKHSTAGYGTDCKSCHTGTTTWLGASFDHPATFPLTNAHANKTCTACHTNGVYTGLNTACASCHTTKFNATTNPKHSSAGFNTTCTTCHTTVAWKPANYTHPASFPLTGGHTGQACTTCHTGNVYKGLPTTCVSCHQAKYNATTNPKHSTVGYGTDCQACHNTSVWTGAVFNHSANFPLTNAHANVACTTCHKKGVYTGLNTACASCHTTKYNATTNPKHSAAAFNTTCNTCHTTTAWTPTNYTHIASFPLTDGHAGKACVTCHKNNVYKGLPATCVSCHITKYNATTNPKHSTVGYGTDCKSCHTGTVSWAGAVFNHPATFPLTNAHANKSCTACHTGGVYTGLNTACASCHTTKYNATSKPKHSVAGFNTTCVTCHTTTAWTPSTYTHIASFPLTNGHAGKACATCHTGNVYKGLPATCVSCHLTKYNATTAPKHSTAGYNTDCKSCHTDTSSWLTAVFNHPATFPLTNAHANQACTACHIGGVYTGLNTACAFCHTAKYNATTKPKHSAAAFDTTCNTCHTTSAWTPTTYTHIASFPLTGGHAGQACTTCHTGTVYKGLPATCVSCHQDKYNATTTPKHSTVGYGTDCKTCHTGTTSWLGAVFNHPATFPLTNAHANKACATCHTSGVYTGLNTACASCHTTKFNATTNPPHTAAGFNTTCNTCHATTAWKPATYTHIASFPLTNGHAGQACTTCHTGNVYKGLPATCASCHLDKYNATTTPKHTTAGFGTDCKTCHNTSIWTDAVFNHPATFPLTNAHANVSCSSCHKGGVYTGLSTTCVSCHQTKYDATTNPQHAAAGFNTTCNTCHATTAWKPATYTHIASFPLTNGHAGKACTTCHTGTVYKGLPSTCVSCHLTKYNATTTPKHTTVGYGTDCKSCHTNTTTWLDAVFNHPATFPLTNAHANKACTLCHTTGVYTGLNAACASCHTAKYNATTNPPHAAAVFNTTCNTCHTTSAWTPTTYTHIASFPLTNGHAGQTCTTCHVNGIYKGLPSTCVSCHLSKYNATTTPKHTTVGYGTDCKSCHTGTTTWLNAVFNHPATFPLTNAHANQTCTACHTGGVYTGLNTACASCHTTKYNATVNPKHSAAGFNTTCNTCHTTSAWTPTTYTHIASFPLTNGHAGKTCTTCHTGTVYKGLPATCVSCHLTKYNATTTPKHTTVGYGTDCKSCHTGTTTWLDAVFNHPATFPLTNAHANKACTACHTSGVYTGLNTACASCHTTKFNATINPPHTAAGFNTTCNTCHTTTAWTPTTYTHIASFPLTGGHTGKSCTTCHKNNVYKGLPASCVSCHLTKYNATTTPKHSTIGYGTDCQACHNTSTWTGAVFTHSAAFPLTNAHANVSCTTCHTSGVYTGLSTACASCHQAKYNATTNPPHTAAAFNTTCNTCHTTSAWTPTTYTHIARFPLSGGHAGKTCTTCHTGNVYRGLPATCVSCHLSKYNATTTPKHTTVGYGTDCKSCHTNTTTWLNAVFNHPATFPLTNAHANKACTACHTSGVYTGLSTACASCHTTKYNATTNPKHSAAGFATTCNTCHTTSAWTPTTYTHIASFPLTGGHAGKTCITCHTGTVYKGLPATCVSCHLTKYNATTNPKHTTVGYGTDCKSCHTNTTTWLNAVFNHPATFPLTNAHANKSCTACHTSGVYTGLSTACVSCHQTKYNATTNPQHTAAGFNTTCNTCHTTTGWTPATYTHIASFPLTGGHAGKTCITCHTGTVYKGLPSTCVSCHLAKYNATTNPKHSTAGYGTDCKTCHTGTTTWLGAVFNHPSINRGPHSGLSCIDCHTTPSNYALFSCIICHTHNKASTDSNHKDVKNYVYASASCYNCHSSGNVGGVTAQPAAAVTTTPPRTTTQPATTQPTTQPATQPTTQKRKNPPAPTTRPRKNPKRAPNQ